ncbi:hypothetical protein Taro_019659 [Colocasia esculenta]|uniref:Aminotransferase-like plant mobile domain-containing protein n=1 Tax=Colocasia esculenta TaxID=4460 RepID=A0A843UUH2_COLES|nr:hypothetical protein [Colocasia esculenta]
MASTVGFFLLHVGSMQIRIGMLGLNMQCNNIFHMLPIDIVFNIIERIVKSIIELLAYTTGYGGQTWREKIMYFYMHKSRIGLRIDGEPVVAAPQVPTRWQSYLDMCQDLLGVDILNLNRELKTVANTCTHVCMAVLEVHMPERVWRQFGAPQVITPAPERYDRKDGRGHTGKNWLVYHAINIERWNARANTILEPPTQEEDESQWRQWYERQSNLYLTPFSEEPPTEYCPKGSIERALVDVTFRIRELLITNPEASYLDVKKEILKL